MPAAEGQPIVVRLVGVRIGGMGGRKPALGQDMTQGKPGAAVFHSLEILFWFSRCVLYYCNTSCVQERAPGAVAKT